MKNTEQRSELSFDGFGINGPDEYRSRIATFEKPFPNGGNREKYGPMFAAAPEMLAALKETAYYYHNLAGHDKMCGDLKSCAIPVCIANREIIDKAEGK